MLPHQLLKLAFHLLYYQLAFTYDWVAWLVSFGQWPAWRRLALDFAPPGPILELAYGTGGLFEDMLAVGRQPVGIDLSPYMARLAARRLHRRGYALTLSRARGQQLPFPADHFASVIATFPTPYIFEPATLAEIRRVLRPDGRLIIVMEGHLQGPPPLRSIIDGLYAITAQRGYHLAHPVSRFEPHHFLARWHIAEHHGVSARLLLADKQPAPPLFSER
jgi:ubiquinone/menaquinone biosynthesis C-methylase UbiE